MKKYLLFIMCLLLITGCDVNIFKSRAIEPNYVDEDREDPETFEPEYIDDNPVILSLYVGDDDGFIKKVPNEFYKTWVKKKDITVFYILLTDEEKTSGYYFQDIWKKYADNYETSYKVAWYLYFTLKDGTEIEQMIFSPKDVERFYDYLEIYLYDSANAKKDVWYSHLLENEMTDKTIMTSMKLTAGSKYEMINSPIMVMAFSYDGADDFDASGNYRGHSKYIVNVYND